MIIIVAIVSFLAGSIVYPRLVRKFTTDKTAADTVYEAERILEYRR